MAQDDNLTAVLYGVEDIRLVSIVRKEKHLAHV